jgi:hypothetical protein
MFMRACKFYDLNSKYVNALHRLLIFWLLFLRVSHHRVDPAERRKYFLSYRKNLNHFKPIIITFYRNTISLASTQLPFKQKSFSHVLPTQHLDRSIGVPDLNVPVFEMELHLVVLESVDLNQKLSYVDTVRKSDLVDFFLFEVVEDCLVR